MPMQNGCIERFNGSFRDELLNTTPFSSRVEARTGITAWKEDYDRFSPQFSRVNLTPAELTVKTTLESMAKGGQTYSDVFSRNLKGRRDSGPFASSNGRCILRATIRNAAEPGFRSFAAGARQTL